MPKPSFDDRSLMAEERRARLEGRVSKGLALDSVAGKRQPDEQVRRLVLAAQQGDRDSFWELVVLNWKRIHLLCYRFVGKEEAERLAGEACDKAWEKRERLDPEGNFGAYLAKVAENHCLDWLRHEKRKGPLAQGRMGSTDDVKEDGEGGTSLVIEGIADPTAVDPEKYVSFTLAVERTLRRLSEVQRDVFLLRFAFGYSRAEIAELKDCTVQNVGYHERLAKAGFLEYFPIEWGEVHL